MIARERKFPVSDLNLKKTAIRLLGQTLVSPEMQYIQRHLGPTATQKELDDSRRFLINAMPRAHA